jgi:hypothetical protein
MVCTITSTAKTRRNKGMALFELVIASSIGVLLAAAICSFTLFNVRSFAALANYLDLDSRSRPALDKLSGDIRQASGCSTNFVLAANNLTLVGTNAVSLLPYTLNYKYESNKTVLTRTYTDANGTQTQTLLTNCTYFALSYFQRNPSNASYGVFPVDDPARPDLCKLIQINWSCSRSILGKPANTESIQSARIVIRKG